MNRRQENSHQRVTPCGKLILYCCKLVLVLTLIPLLFLVALLVFHSVKVQRFINDIRFYPHILIPAERETDLIAFVCAEDGTDLFTIHPDGRQLRLINNGNYMSHSQLNWSPDGSWIALEKEYERHWNRSSGWFVESIDSEIYLVRFDGLVLRRLTYNRYDDRDPRWSDDGRAIYFEAQGLSYAVNHLGMVMQADLSNQRPSRLHTIRTSSSHFSSDELASASLSPTGEWLAIGSPNGEHSAHGKWIKLSQDESAYSWRPVFLYLLHLDTGQVKRFVYDVIHPDGVSWSPDGEWLAFATWDTTALFKIRPDGTALEQLTDLDCRVTEVSWSPT